MDETVLPPSLREFFPVIWEDWGSRVSGTLSVPFTALMLYAKADYARAIWGVLAFVGILATIYQVWARERKTVVDLQSELNTNADVRGTLHICVQENAPAHMRLSFPTASFLQYQYEGANHGRAYCEVGYLVFEIVLGDGSKTEHKIKIVPEAKKLKHAEGFRYEGVCAVQIPHDELVASKMSALALDSLGDEHKDQTVKFYGSCSSKAAL
jgi:hypothetical protein